MKQSTVMMLLPGLWGSNDGCFDDVSAETVISYTDITT